MSIYELWMAIYWMKKHIVEKTANYPFFTSRWSSTTWKYMWLMSRSLPSTGWYHMLTSALATPGEKKCQRRLIHLHMETLQCRSEPCRSSERWSEQVWTGIAPDCSRECVLFVRQCVRRSPGVGAVQHLLGLAPYHLLFQVVEHSDPEQHPAQRKPSGHNKALTRHKRWASRTNTHMHTSRHTHT